jgi:ADP-heptose:LPS heptosyltransferase
LDSWVVIRKSLIRRLALLRSESVTFIRYALLVVVLGNLTKWERWHKKAAGSLRVLVVRQDRLGDFLLTTPFLRELKQNFPKSHITLVVRCDVRELAMNCPYVDAVETIDPDKVQVRDLIELMKFVRSNLHGRYDLALLPRWDVDVYWSTLIACLSGARRIVAYSRKTSRRKALMNWGHESVVTEELPPGPFLHEIDRALALVTYLGGTIKSRAMELWLSAGDEREADRFLEVTDAARLPRPWVALGIGASQERRQWPYFADLLAAMNQKMSLAAFAFVGPGELQSANKLKELIPGCVVVCKPIGIAAAIMSRCDMFVGNDSGPLHIAAAAGLPSVEISCHPLNGDPASDHSPARFGHVGGSNRVVQPVSGLNNCSATCLEDFPHCISQVTPGQVISAIKSLIEVRV